MRKNLVVLLISAIPLPAIAQIAQRQDTTIAFVNRQKPSIARASAYAPNIISKCSGSLAGGAQGQFAGISFAGSYKDEFCERAELIKLAISMGHGDVADNLFYQFSMVKDLNKKEKSQEICDYPTKCEKRR